MDRFFVLMFAVSVAWLVALLYLPGLNPLSRRASPEPGKPQQIVKRPLPPATRPPVRAPDVRPTPPGRERPVLASATIGPEGGRVEVAGRVSVAFPPGALQRAERIVIREGWPASRTSAGYAVEREGGHGFLAKAARIEYTLPESPGKDLFTFLEAAPGIVVVHPAVVDASGKVSIEVLHFSLEGWFEEWRDFMLSAGVTLVVTAVPIVIKYGAKAVGGPVSAGLALISFGAGVAYDRYKSGKPWLPSGPVHVEGIDIRWDRNALPRRPSAHIWLDESWVVCASVDDATYELGRQPAGVRHPTDPARYVKLAELQHWVVPNAILELARWFEPARTWYSGLVSTLPSSVPVFVYALKDAGGWNGKELDLTASDVNDAFGSGKTGQAQQDAIQHLLASVAHEYYHAIATNNGWHDAPFPGAEESIACTLENVVFRETWERATFTENIGMDEVRIVLGNGLLEPGPGENYPTVDRRGYRLWPFGKWVAHTHGMSEVLRVAQGALDRKGLEAHFAGFARSLLSADRLLKAMEPLKLPGGQSGPTRTGFDLIDLDKLASPAKGPGAVAGLDRSRPLSVRVIKLELAPRTPDQPTAPLIVRRVAPDAAEDLLVLPPGAVASDGVLSRVATASELKEGSGGVAVGAAAADAPFVGIVAIGRAGTSALPSPLVSYRLVPPTAVRMETVNGPDGAPRLKISWAAPIPGAGLAASDVYAGYKVVGKQKDGSLVELARLLFDAPGAPAPPGPAVQTIPRDCLGPVIAGRLPADVVQVGLVSLDGALPIGQPDARMESAPGFAVIEQPPDVKVASVDLKLPFRWRSTTVTARRTTTREDEQTEAVSLESDAIQWSGRTGTISKKSGSVTHTISFTVASDGGGAELDVKIVGSSVLTRAAFPRLPLVEKMEIGKTGAFVCLYGIDQGAFAAASPVLMGKSQSKGQVAGDYAMEWVPATTTLEVIGPGTVTPGRALLDVRNFTEDEAAAMLKDGRVGQQEVEAFEAKYEQLRSRFTGK